MKYNKNNPPLVCMATKSSCYNGTTIGVPVGVLWHSTGANNPRLSRYVQPSPDDPNREELLKILGKNTGANDWNNYPIQAGLTAWIGKAADGSVMSVITLPYDYRAWGCASGKNGSCNGSKYVKNSPFWLQFEICEDNLTNKDYFEATYKEAVELTAYWCKMFGFDPHGTVMYNGVKVPVILCHYDSYWLGLGSNHIDVEHWFKRYGKTMANVRDDVAALLEADRKAEEEAAKQTEEEDEDMTQEKFNEMMNAWLTEQAERQPSDWSAEDREWAENNGIIRGDNKGRKMYKKFVTREEMAAMLHRTHELG